MQWIWKIRGKGQILRKTENTLPKLIEDTQNLSSSIKFIKVIEDIKTFPAKKMPGPDKFPGLAFQTLIEDKTPILHKLF